MCNECNEPDEADDGDASGEGFSSDPFTTATRILVPRLTYHIAAYLRGLAFKAERAIVHQPVTLNDIAVDIGSERAWQGGVASAALLFAVAKSCAHGPAWLRSTTFSPGELRGIAKAIDKAEREDSNA